MSDKQTRSPTSETAAQSFEAPSERPFGLLPEPLDDSKRPFGVVPEPLDEEPYLVDDAVGDAPPVVVPVSIYLADERLPWWQVEQVEMAVEGWLATANVSISTREDPVIGSWFRRMKAVALSPVARETLLTGVHVADNRLILGQDAYVTATLLQNVGPVLTALHPTANAVIRAGALLILKVDWVVHVYQLTAAQQAVLDHQPQLAASPEAIFDALNLAAQEPEKVVLPDELGLPSAAQASGRDKPTVMKGN